MARGASRGVNKLEVKTIMKIEVKVSDLCMVYELKKCRAWAKELRSNPTNLRIKVDGVVRRVVHDAIRNICICGFLKCVVSVHTPFKACIFVICETLEGFVSAFIGVERSSFENWDGWQIDGFPIVRQYKEVN